MWQKGKKPTNGDVFNWLTEEMGYDPNADVLMLKQRFRKNGDQREIEILPANYKKVGRLFLVWGKEKLKILDLTDAPSDLIDPAYNQFEWFQKAKDQGYDGVRISDYAQSEIHGNIGHVSIGLFDSGVKKVKMESIDATKHDWTATSGPSLDRTPELTKWHRQQIEDAIEQGQDIPPEVMQEYYTN